MQYQTTVIKGKQVATTLFWKKWKKPDLRAEMSKILQPRMTTVNWALLNRNLHVGPNNRDTHPPF